MKNLTVRGYSQGEIARLLYKRSKLSDDVIVLPNTPMAANMRFDRVALDFDKDNHHRPYFSFTEGRIDSIVIPNMRELVPELKTDKMTVRFNYENMIDISLRWDLSEKELTELIPKGLFGSDYAIDHDGKDNPNLRPKGGEGIVIPEEFTDTIWEEIPINGTFRMVMDKHMGKKIPIISIEPELDNGFARTNSRVSGYKDIAVYVAEKQYYPSSEKADFGDYISLENTIEVESRPSAEPKTIPMAKEKKPDYEMTPSEQREAAYLSQLAGNIEERKEAYHVDDDVDYMASMDGKINPDNPDEVYTMFTESDPYDTTVYLDTREVESEESYEDSDVEVVKEGEAFTEEELADMGFTPHVSHENERKDTNQTAQAIAAGERMIQNAEQGGAQLE